VQVGACEQVADLSDRVRNKTMPVLMLTAVDLSPQACRGRLVHKAVQINMVTACCALFIPSLLQLASMIAGWTAISA
jgi:hypothetical protein